PRDRTDSAQACGPLGVRGDDAAHRIAVTAEVLRRTVEDEGGPVIEGTLQHRSAEGVVDQDRDVSGGGDDGVEVDEVEARVRRSLDDDESGVRTDGRVDLALLRPGHRGAEQA